MRFKSIAAATVLLGAAMATTGSMAASAVAPAHEIAVYHDVGGNRIPYRYGAWNGTIGFGYAKISTWHNVRRLASVKFAIHNPVGGEPIAVKNDLEYYAWANKGYLDNAGTVHYTDSVELMVVARFGDYPKYHDWTINGTPGVITAYCHDYRPRCPSWVDEAFSNGGAVISDAQAQAAVDDTSSDAGMTADPDPASGVSTAAAATPNGDIPVHPVHPIPAGSTVFSGSYANALGPIDAGASTGPDTDQDPGATYGDSN